MEGQLALAMFVAVCAILLLGFPVALTLGGTALGFAVLGILIGHFDPDYLTALTGRIFGTMGNETLVAVPLFILMGVVLERAKISEDLLANMAGLFGERPGGLGVAVIVVGALLAASTGIVGATVVTMGVLALPSMLRAGYQPQLATGTICATGTLGQIIPPSIALVLLGDIMSSAYQQAQLRMNIINTDTVSVGDLFIGAMMPGITLVMMYLAYVLLRAAWQPDTAPPRQNGENRLCSRHQSSAATTWIDRLGSGLHSRRRRYTHGGGGRGGYRRFAACACKRCAHVFRFTGHFPVHPLHHQYGLPDSDRGRHLLAGLPRIWWRRTHRGIL